MCSRLFKILILLVFSFSVRGQNTTLKIGDAGLPLILNNNQNTLQSISFPYLNKIVLVHFWSSSVSKSKAFIPRILDLSERYTTTTYRNTDGFEIFSVAIQSDKTAWNQDLLDFKMDNITNLIAQRGYNDLSIRGYKISQLPLTVLIDESGKIIMINPTMLEIEDVLDGKKNSPTNTKDISGRLLLSENPKDILPNHKMVLMNKFGDTISRTVTEPSGNFTFSDVKFLSDYIIKLDTSGKLMTTKKAFLSTVGGAVFGEIANTNGVYELKLGQNDISKLTSDDKENSAAKNALTLKSNITFKTGTTDFDSNAEAELDKIIVMMSKNKTYTTQIFVHTDSRGDDEANLELSKKRAAAIKAYIVANGISALRLKPIGKGESEILNKCKNNVTCTEIEHMENNRVEFKFIKP